MANVIITGEALKRERQRMIAEYQEFNNGLRMYMKLKGLSYASLPK